MLIMENKNHQHISKGILVPIIWMMRTASRGISYWLSPETMANTEIDYLQGSPLDRNFLIILEVLGLAVLLSRNVNWIQFIKQNKYLILLYVFMGISILWSDFPGVSLKRWIRTAGDLIMVTILITETGYSSAIQKIFRTSAYFLIPVSVYLIKYRRDLGVSYDNTGAFEMWVGVTTHKNSLGQLSAISAIFLTWALLTRIYKKKWFDIPVLISALWLLNGSRTATSRTSVGVFVFGLIVLGILLIVKSHYKVIQTTLLVVVAGYVLGTLLSQHLFSSNFIPFLVASTGGDPTLTGRTFLWDELMKMGSAQWMYGSGFGAFWIGNISNNLWEMFRWNPGQAHNGYIDVYLELGVIGFTLFLIFLVSVVKNILINISHDSDYGRLRMVLFAMILIYNVTESSFLKPTSFLWFVMLLISVKAAEHYPGEETKEDIKLNKKERKNLVQSV